MSEANTLLRFPACCLLSPDLPLGLGVLDLELELELDVEGDRRFLCWDLCLRPR